MPLNQLLHDEQVTLIRAAHAKDGREAEVFRNRLAGLNCQISAYPFRQRGAAVESNNSKPGETKPLQTLWFEVPQEQLAGVDHWTRVWGVSRAEAIERLIDRGLGSTSHLMRSS